MPKVREANGPGYRGPTSPGAAYLSVFELRRTAQYSRPLISQHVPRKNQPIFTRNLADFGLGPGGTPAYEMLCASAGGNFSWPYLYVL